MRTIKWTTKGSKGEIYDCRVKVDDIKKIILWIDCSCWNFVNRRIQKSGVFSDIVYYAEPCKHLKPIVEVLEKQGYTLKKPKPISGNIKCTSELRRFLVNRSGGICEMNMCNNIGECVHRIIRGNSCGRYNEDNCVLLCSDCHKKIHSGEFK